jgi:GH25 family lysozyme M1 (1,4-beta-N-acetylmuramidase)
VIRGIDVSSHQDRIDWARVQTDGIEFAIVKASEGVGFADPSYGSYTAGARSVGITCGAYHFARPDTHSSASLESARTDARAEADWFLSVAQLRRDDLLPALDLETAGLAPDRMVAWTRAWLDRVRRRIGARPLLYTYPAFWTSLGGTSAFRSYPLWIANYGVREPQLPGGWRRYALWQYSASGHVPGIPGRVDLSRLDDRLTLADVSYRPQPTPPPRKRNFPGPVPKPGWFWPWVRWRLGSGEFEGLAGTAAVRPDEAPDEIPEWAHRSVEKLVGERRRKRRTRRARPASG